MQAYQALLTMVEQRTGLGPREAERAARATLGAFAERLSGGQARDLAQHLPDGFLRPVVVLPERRPEPFGVEEFLRRVDELGAVDQDTAEAVLTAVRVMAGEKEWADAVAQLPRDFAPLVEQRPHAGIHSTVEFVARVASRTGDGGGSARRAADAVLETLGERLPSDEVDRLTHLLPGQLRGPLERGAAQTTATRGLSADGFVATVAERSAASPERARRQAQAVLGAVAAAIPEPDFYDTIVLQLPDDYAELLAPA
ncbi:MAG TPA: DUF2267 domain-containing protein [Mycobacteriales bacterium]|jgi:uncharacterized protein (DUF2267 family)